MARPSRRRSSTEGGDADMNVRIVIMTVAMAATAGAVWAKLPAAPADLAKAAEAKAKAEQSASADKGALGAPFFSATIGLALVETVREARRTATENHRDHPAPEAPQRNHRREADEHGKPLEAARETLRPKHVPREEHREIENHADHSGGDPGEGCGELEIPVRRFHQRTAEENEEEGRQERA